MGVCIGAGPVRRGKLKTRFITLVDFTNVKIDILLWREECEKFQLDDYPILLIWGVQVRRTYQGQLVLNVQRCHDYIHEPDFTAVNELRDWWFTAGIQNLENLTYAQLISSHPLANFSQRMDYYLANQPISIKDVATLFELPYRSFDRYLLDHGHRQRNKSSHDPDGIMKIAVDYKRKNAVDKTYTLKKHLEVVATTTGRSITPGTITGHLSRSDMTTKKKFQAPQNRPAVLKTMEDYLQKKKKDPTHTLQLAVKDKPFSVSAVANVLRDSGLSKKQNHHNKQAKIVSEAVDFYLKQNGRYTYKEVQRKFNSKYKLTGKDAITEEGIKTAKCRRSKKK